MFVIKIDRAEETPDTFDVTTELQRISLEREMVEAFQRHRKADGDAEVSTTKMEEQESKVKSIKERLAGLGITIDTLQNEQHRLQREEEAMSLHLARLTSHAQDLGELRDCLLGDAENLHRRFLGQSSNLDLPDHVFEDWSATGIEKMLQIVGSSNKRNEPTVDSTQRLLLTAAQKGNYKPFRHIVKQEFDIEMETKSGIKLLSVAALGGNMEIVQMLLTLGADVQESDKDGWTALHYATEGDHFEVARLLIANGSVIDARSLHGHTPLFIASRDGMEAVAQVLLELGSNGELAAEDSGDTPLMAAAGNGHLAIVEKLLSFGVDSASTHYYLRNTARDFARKNGHTAIVKLLDDWGTPPDADNPRVRTRSSRLAKIGATIMGRRNSKDKGLGELAGRSLSFPSRSS
ncbi:hypothetical protein PG985_008885 [Apiospora marii]|uniref:uncharacterized protein n=1 Tax=Apiospora marii TaxID=335849 RepID=UPI00312DEA67